MQRNQPTTSQDTERTLSVKSRGLKFGPKLRPNQRARLWRKIGAHCRHKLRIAPRWSRHFLPRRILDEIWPRDRKNEQRDAVKPILRKTPSRTDETAPILEKDGFFLLRLRFTPLRRQLTASPEMILEITSSFGGIFVYSSNRVWSFPEYRTRGQMILGGRNPIEPVSSPTSPNGCKI